MRILVLCDDVWHPARTPRAGLAALDAGDFTFDWQENAATFAATDLVAYDVVILTKANNVSAQDKTPWMTPAVERALCDYVQQGKGLLVIHSGVAGYEETQWLRGLLGGVFVRHPPQCEVTVEPLAGHPLTAGSAAFTLKDEHYFMTVDDPTVDHFLTTTSEHGSQPGGWTRRDGAGRVCVLAPGHNLEIWLHPAYQTLIRNGLVWCAGLAV